MDVRTVSQTRDRYDRYVRRTRLCISAGAPRHRLAFAVEEALRLASLPGEDEGRYYYFRHLQVTGLPMSGDRARWLEIFQRALIQQASQAIHGSDARAAEAPSVFFRGEVEALEILLRRILARQSSLEWFWPMVTSPARDAAPGFIAGSAARGAAMIPAIVEQIRATPASWGAVAAIIFAVPGLDAVYLLEAIPARVAETWLREMEGSMRDASGAAPSNFVVSAALCRGCAASFWVRRCAHALACNARRCSGFACRADRRRRGIAREDRTSKDSQRGPCRGRMRGTRTDVR